MRSVLALCCLAALLALVALPPAVTADAADAAAAAASGGAASAAKEKACDADAAKATPKAASSAVSVSAAEDSPSADGDEEYIPPFVATHEWQETMPGQEIPPNLDLRVELATGKEYARLKPVPKKQDLQLDDASTSQRNETAADRAARVATMYNVLLSLPEPPPELSDQNVTRLTPQQLEDLLKTLWDRRQVYLREAYAEMKTEAELMEGNLAMLSLLSSSKPDDRTRMLELLEELEFLVANTDNAHTLDKIQGWPKVIERLNDTDAEVALRAAWVVGTAVKLDEVVQGQALDRGLLPVLVGELTTRHSDLKLSSKMVYAIACLLRDNRRSQRIFAGISGFDAVRSALGTALNSSAASKLGQKLFARVAALVSDLLDEGSLPRLQARVEPPSVA